MHSTYQQVTLVSRYMIKVFPLVHRELTKWEIRAGLIPDHVLRKQALASIRSKRFHCLGGTVYALFPGVDIRTMVTFIVAFQTISDYLDNLCDRAGYCDEQVFRQLHLAFTDALTPGGNTSDYYRDYPHDDDGGYLLDLVYTSRQALENLPSYHLAQQQAVTLAGLYADLQSLKHAEPEQREAKLRDWAVSHLPRYPGITPWEFAAATGSTLGVFYLTALSASPTLQSSQVEQAVTCYFPYICGFHILLDYLIDREEDLAGGDFNFTFYYQNVTEMCERLELFHEKALLCSNILLYPSFHKTVIDGLLAMYLSDAKAFKGDAGKAGNYLIRRAGRRTAMLRSICRLLRAFDWIMIYRENFGKKT